MKFIKKILNRIYRICILKKGIYGKYGKHNKFAEGVLIYENAKIGNYNYFSPYSIVNNAIIKNYCSIGPGARIGLGTHMIHSVSTFPKVNNGTKEMDLFDINNPTVIESDCWIGTNAIILQGVHVGFGSIIGAGAVVTKDVPPFAIVIGVPAKIHKYRFNNEVRQKILISNWDIVNLEEAKKIVNNIYEENKEEMEN